MMADNGQVATAEEYGVMRFEARVLDTTRTFCEKIMSLVRFSYTEDPLGDLKKKIRHTYRSAQAFAGSEDLRVFRFARL